MVWNTNMILTLYKNLMLKWRLYGATLILERKNGCKNMEIMIEIEENEKPENWDFFMSEGMTIEEKKARCIEMDNMWNQFERMGIKI